MNKYLKSALILVIGLVLCLLENNLFAVSDDHIVSTKTVETIYRKNQTVYFTFANDGVDYSFTEHEGVSCDYIMENIGVGDEVIITTENNIGEFTYTLIKEMSKNGRVIYSSIEYYKNHNTNLKLIFMPTTFIISLILAISALIDLEKKNIIDSFTIWQPKCVINLFAATAAGGVTIPVIFTILYSSGNMSYKTYSFSYLFCFFLIMGILGLYTSLKQKLVYDGRKYIIYDPFKKTREIDLSDVDYLLIDRTVKGRKNKSGIYDKDENKIQSLTLELFFCLKKKLFLQSLIDNNVCFYELIKKENGECVRIKIDVSV